MSVNNEQWSEWLEWSGGECQVPDGSDCQVRFRCGEEDGDGSPELWDWSHSGHAADIIAYRYRLDNADERINNIARNGNDGDHYATPEEDEEWQAMEGRQKRSKYHVQIRPGVYVDVYDVLHAFGVTNPGDQHAIKKMLMPGKRGHKDAIEDRREAIQSLERAIELEGRQ